MLICQTCQKQNATVHRIDVHWDGEQPNVHEAHLCAPCAKSSGIPVQTPPPFQKVLGMLSQAFLPKDSSAPGAPAPATETGPECPDCGWTLRDLRQTSRLGCPNDYAVFADHLEETLERMHGQTAHVGFGEESALDRLTLELDEAVAQEDYETAARLRDDIQRLEKALEDDEEDAEPSSGGRPRADNGE